jgi:hypothetical protein
MAPEKNIREAPAGLRPMLAPLALLVAWIAFPLVLAALSFGCAGLLEGLSGERLPRPLVLPAGLTVLILVAQFTTLSATTAKASVAVVAAFAAVGLIVSRPWQRPVDPWALAAA